MIAGHVRKLVRREAEYDGRGSSMSWSRTCAVGPTPSAPASRRPRARVPDFHFDVAEAHPVTGSRTAPPAAAGRATRRAASAKAGARSRPTRSRRRLGRRRATTGARATGRAERPRGRRCEDRRAHGEVGQPVEQPPSVASQRNSSGAATRRSQARTAAVRRTQAHAASAPSCAAWTATGPRTRGGRSARRPRPINSAASAARISARRTRS